MGGIGRDQWMEGFIEHYVEKGEDEKMMREHPDLRKITDAIFDVANDNQYDDVIDYDQFNRYFSHITQEKYEGDDLWIHFDGNDYNKDGIMNDGEMILAMIRYDF